jgi:hypothetical protein
MASVIQPQPIAVDALRCAAFAAAELAPWCDPRSASGGKVRKMPVFSGFFVAPALVFGYTLFTARLAHT